MYNQLRSFLKTWTLWPNLKQISLARGYMNYKEEQRRVHEQYAKYIPSGYATNMFKVRSLVHELKNVRVQTT